MTAPRFGWFFLVLILILEPAGFAEKSSHFGKAVTVEGEVKVRRRFKLKEVKKEDTLMVKDQVMTGEGASLEILLGDKNNLKINENSRLTLTRTTDKKGKKEIMIKLMAGTIRSKLNGLKDSGEVFSIRSPVAVAGVRGTDFVTGYNPALGAKAFNLTVLEGSVDVSGIDKATQKATGSIQVKPAQKITFSDTGEMKGVSEVSPKEMKQLRESFYVQTDGAKEEKDSKKGEGKSKEKKEDEKEEGEDKEDKGEGQGEEKGDQTDQEEKEGDGGQNEDTGDDGEASDNQNGDQKDGLESSDEKAEPSGGKEASTDNKREGEATKNSQDTTEPKETKVGEGSTGENPVTETPSGAVATEGESMDAEQSPDASTESQAPVAESPPTLSVETVAVDEPDAPEVELQVEPVTMDTDVDLEPDVEIDLSSVDTAVDQTQSVVEDVVNDQIQDQVDAINQEVNRTLQLLIRQGD